MYYIKKKKSDNKLKRDLHELHLNHELKMRQEELDKDRDFKAQDAIGKTMEVISKLLDKTLSKMKDAPEDLRNIYLEKIKRYECWIEDIAKFQKEALTTAGNIRADDAEGIMIIYLFWLNRTDFYRNSVHVLHK